MHVDRKTLGSFMTRLLLRTGKDPFAGVCAPTVLEQNLLVSNVGNQLFQHSVYRALSTPRTEVVPNGTLSETVRATAEDAARVNAEFDAFVIPMANAFRPEFRHRLVNLTSLVEQLTIPTVVVGVGVQTDIDIDGRYEDLRRVAGAVRAFVSAVLERSTTIGVRGTATADYLVSLGVPSDRIDVIGCPSVYWHGPDFQLPPPQPWPGDDARVAFSMTPHVAGLGPLCRSWTARHPRLEFIGQDNQDLALALWGKEPRGGGDPALPTHRAHPLFREGRVGFPLDMRTWLDHLRTKDFAIGTRLHGAVAAMLADTPAVLLVHDSRTRELAEFHRLPHRRMSQVAPGTSLAELYDASDPAPFNDAYGPAFAGFTAFLERNGLSHVYAAGASSPEFDARLAAAELPPMVRPLPPEVPEEVVNRLRWLHGAATFDPATHPDAYRFPYPYPQPSSQASARRRSPETQRQELADQRVRLSGQRRQLEEHRRRLADQRRRLNEQGRRLTAVQAELADLRAGSVRRAVRAATRAVLVRTARPSGGP